MNNEIIRFSLSSNFREPFRLSGSNRDYVGRRQELHRLRNLIANMSAANILISGVRGAGKSSYVNQTLADYSQEDSDAIIVDISLAHMHVNGQGSDEVGDYVLKALIRGLYFSIKEKENDTRHKIITMPASLVELYEMTYFKDLKSEEVVELVKAASVKNENKVKEEVVHTKEFAINDNVVKALVSIGYLVFGVLSHELLITHWWLVAAYFVTLLTILLMPIRLLQTKLNSKLNKEVFSVEGDHKKRESGVASLDLSAQTLEIALKNVLKALEEKGVKTIFVLDELDKLNVSDDSKDVIYNIAESMKNLFTLSSAIFIFITADDFFDDLNRRPPYGKEHTLFTNTIFLPNMTFSDVSDLIDRFKDGELLVGDKNVYDKFKYYMGWKTSNHVFDVHSHIDHFTVYGDNGNCYVSVKEDGRRGKGNIDEDWEILSAMHRVITELLDVYSHPNNPRLNDKLYWVLRHVASRLYEEDSITVSNNDYISLVNDPDLDTESLSEKEKEDFDGIINDMLQTMNRLDNFVKDSRNEDGITFSLVSNPSYPPGAGVINIRDHVLDFESEFLDKYSRFNKVKKNIEEAGLNTLNEYDEQAKSWEEIANSINKREKNRPLRSVVQSSSEQIDSLLEDLPRKIMVAIVDNVTSSRADLQMTSMDRDINRRPIRTSDPKMEAFYDVVNSNYSQDYRMLQHPSASKCIIVGFDFDESVQKEFDKVPRNERVNTLPRVFNIVSSKDKLNTKGLWYWKEASLNCDTYNNVRGIISSIHNFIYRHLK